MVLAKIAIKHSHARGVRGVAAYRGLVCAMYTVRVFSCSEVCGLILSWFTLVKPYLGCFTFTFSPALVLYMRDE